MASNILYDAWYKDRKDNVSEENRRILKKAVNLLRNEIRCTNFESEHYPSNADIIGGANFLPPVLRYFMQCLVSNELKQASIGQCLLKLMKPNGVIPPLLFGLGVEVDHTIGSKTLLVELAKLVGKEHFISWGSLNVALLGQLI